MTPKLRALLKRIEDGKKLTDEQESWLAKEVNTYWDDHPDVVNRFPRWKKYLAWVAGYQKFDYNKITKKLVEVPLKRSNTIIFNRLKPFVRQLLGKMTQEMPTMSVVPKTDDDDDIEAARAGDRVAENLAENTNWDQQYIYMALWVIVCNRAYLRTYWSKDDYGVLGYSDGQAEGADSIEGLVDAEEPLPVGEPITEDGDVRIECIPPFNCRQDPLYQERTKWRWFIFGEEVDATELEEEYELEEGSLKKMTKSMEDAYELELQDEQDIVIGAPDKDDAILGRTVIRKEFWTPKVYVFVAGNKVLEYGENKYKEIPFYAVEDRLIPIDNYQKGFTYNEPPVKDAIPIQRERNRSASIMSTAIDRASKLKIMTPLGSLMSKRQFTNDYGVFIDYNPNAGGQPYQMKIDPFPFEVPQYKQDLEREMESVMNMHETSFGRLPERASHASGTLVNILLEQDDVVINPLLNQMNRTVEDAWKMAMKIVKDNYVASRLIRYTGEDGRISVMKFKGADLRGNTDIKVSSKSGLPRSRALRMEYIMRLRQEGLLPDDKNTLELLEFGNAQKIFKDVLLHERRAYRENMRVMELKDDQISEDEAQDFIDEAKRWIYPLEDHEGHNRVHLRLRLGPKSRHMSEVAKAVLDAHIAGHDNMAKALMIEEARLQAQMQAAMMAAVQPTQEGGGQAQ